MVIRWLDIVYGVQYMKKLNIRYFRKFKVWELEMYDYRGPDPVDARYTMEVIDTEMRFNLYWKYGVIK